MRMYTMFTESHRQMMYDYFLPSLIPNEYLLTVKQFPQRGSGKFMSPGFVETVAYTFDILSGAIDENYGDVFVFSDCDIQFFGPTKAILLDAITDCDLVAQGDGGTTLCTGFFICRASDKMRKVFQKCAKIVKNNPKRTGGDQYAVNCCNDMFTWKILNQQQFWCPRKLWKPGWELNVPKNILMHHANWTLGVAHKMIMLKQVQQIVQGKEDEAGA